MQTTRVARRSLTAFLWLAVVPWAIGLGGKLFELRVLITAWAADPPRSFDLLPYGRRWPNDPGDFFQPVSALLLIASVGALVAGWRAPSRLKRLLWIPFVALVLIWAVTPTLFWPMIQDLIWAANGKRPLDPAAAAALAQRWIVADWLRTALIAVGFGAAVRAFGVHAAERSGPGDDR